MFTLSNAARDAGEAAMWRPCARCRRLYAAAPDEVLCRGCATPEPSATSAPTSESAAVGVRCGAAHPEDGSPCEGPAAAVRVVDQVGDELTGCVHHGSVALASVEGARVYPGPDATAHAAIQAYERAQLRQPFAFDPAGPWPVPSVRCGPEGG